MVCYNELMPKHLVPVLSFGAAVVILLMLNFTTPAEIGPFGVLVFFTMVYVLMLGLGILLVKFFVKLLRRTMRRKDYLYGAVVAFAPIMLMLVQSVGTVSVLTVVLVMMFTGLGCFLVSKRA